MNDLKKEFSQLTVLQKCFFITLAFFLVIGAHWWQRSPGMGGLDTPIMTVGWWCFSIMIGLALLNCHLEGKVKYSSFDFTILLLLIALLVPVLWATNYPVDYYIGRLLGVIGVFFLYQAFVQIGFSEKTLIFVCVLILTSIFIEGVIGICQLLSMDDNRLAMRSNYGMFRQPNVMATALVTGWALSLGLYAKLSNIKKNILQSRKSKVIAFLCLALFAINYVYLDSRTSWVSLAICYLMFIFAFLLGIVNRKLIITSLLYTTLFIALAYCFVSFNSANLGESFSRGLRLGIYKNAWDLIIQKPFLGHGYGSMGKVFLDNYATLHHEGKLAINIAIESNIRHPHNEIFMWAIEGGFFPAVSLIGFALAYLFVVIKYKREWPVFLAVIAPISVHMMTELPLYSSPLLILILIFCVYVSTIKHSEQRELDIRKALFFPILKPFSIAFILCASIFFSTNLYTINRVTLYLFSQPTTTKYLTQIINPIAWKNSLNFYYYAALVDQGLNNKKPQSCYPYKKWSEQILQETHFGAYYEYAVLSYVCLGEKDKAAALVSKMQYIYPNLKDQYQSWKEKELQ